MFGTTQTMNQHSNQTISITACSSGGCNEGQDGYDVCTASGDECKIQCGSETYRDGDYCYRCDDSAGLCATCDGAGLCTTCKKWLDREDGECIDRQQEALDALGAEIQKTEGHGECVPPNALECVAGSECSGTSSGTFVIKVDGTKRVTTLFASNAIHLTSMHSMAST